MPFFGIEAISTVTDEGIEDAGTEAGLVSFSEAARGTGQSYFLRAQNFVLQNFKGNLHSSELGRFTYSGGTVLDRHDLAESAYSLGGSVRFEFDGGIMDFTVGFDSMRIPIPHLKESHVHLHLVAVNGTGRYARSVGFVRFHIKTIGDCATEGQLEDETEVSFLELQTGPLGDVRR